MPFYIYNTVQCAFWNDDRKVWTYTLLGASEFKTRERVLAVAKAIPCEVGNLVILEFVGAS